MNYREAYKRREEVGQEIHTVEMGIYAARQALTGLREQTPVDWDAVYHHKGIIRARHGERHQLEHKLIASKEAIATALTARAIRYYLPPNRRLSGQSRA